MIVSMPATPRTIQELQKSSGAGANPKRVSNFFKNWTVDDGVLEGDVRWSLKATLMDQAVEGIVRLALKQTLETMQLGIDISGRIFENASLLVQKQTLSPKDRMLLQGKVEAALKDPNLSKKLYYRDFQKRASKILTDFNQRQSSVYTVSSSSSEESLSDLDNEDLVGEFRANIKYLFAKTLRNLVQEWTGISILSGFSKI